MKKVDLSEDEKIAYRQQQLRNLHRQSRGVNMGLAASPSQGNNRRNSLVPTGLQRRSSSWRLMPGSNLVGGNASRHGLRGSGGSTGGGVRKLVPPSRDTFSKPQQDMPGSQAFSTDSGDESDDGKWMNDTDSPSNKNADSLDNYEGSDHGIPPPPPPPPPPPLPEEGEGGATDQTTTRREEIPASGSDRDENTKRRIREQRRRQQEQESAVPTAKGRSPHNTTSPHADDDETAKRSIRDQRNEQLQPLPPSGRVSSSGSYGNSSTNRDDRIKQSLLDQRNNDAYAGMQPLPPAGGRATSNGSHQDDSIKSSLKAERRQQQQQEPRTSSSSSVSMNSARSSRDDNIKQRLREERNQNSFSSFDNNNSSSINFPPVAAVTAALEGSESLPSRNSNKARDAGYCDPYEPRSAAPTKSSSISYKGYGGEDDNEESSRSRSTYPLQETRPLPPERQQSQQQFAMKSIERGSDDWNALLQPFVSDLCYQSVVSKRTQKSITFRPRPCQAALLFVDLSGYSKITSALAYAGAHAISACVNSYLSRLVRVLRAHGGDCVKFAGDAIMVVWAGQPHELEINVYCAARAALILQAECGNHPVPGTDHQFQIHCGLAAGTLHSEVFCAPKHNRSMPRLYHVLSGETVQEIGDLVDLAASGELCVSSNCVSFLEGSGRYRHISDQKLADNGFHAGANGAKLLVDLVVTAALTEYMDDHISNKKQEIAEQRQAIVNSTFAEDFIHSSVLDALQHGGLSPTQIAQMRELCVLFIAMTSTGDAVNWLIEVQEILDRNRCPIVQIIQ